MSKQEETKATVKAYTALDDEKVEDEKKRTETLCTWLRENDCEFPYLYFEYYAVDFRGVAISQDLPNHEIILKVSPQCLLTIEKAKESDIGQRIIDSGCRMRSTHSYVAAMLLEERKKGTDSFWWPYIDILPKSYSHMPMLFDEQELGFLSGSLVLEEVRNRKASYEREYKELCSYVPEFAEYSLDEFFWARLVVLTRIFGINIHGRKTSSMVPMADMLNHKRPPETYWTFDNSYDAFTITTSKEFKEGEQVYDSYGRKCNTEFFLNYGFVADANLYNTANIVLTLDDQDPLFARKYQLMGRGGRDVTTIQVPTDYEKDDAEEAFSYLRLAVATDAELYHLTGGDFYRRPNLKRIRPLNFRNELEVLRRFEAAATEAMAVFETTMDDDRTLLEDQSLSMNVRNAIKCRLCEKEVLAFYRDLYTTILPLLPESKSARDATIGLLTSGVVDAQPHLRQYVHSCIIPLFEGEGGEGDITIGDIIKKFSDMTIEQAQERYNTLSNQPDSDSDSF